MSEATKADSQLALFERSPNALAATLKRLDEESRRFAAQARAENTVTAYRADWDHFADWCESLGAAPLPADPVVVRLYITALADNGYATSTISRRLSTIRQAHASAEKPDPTYDVEVRQTWKGIRRELGTAPSQKTALLLEDIRSMTRALPQGLKETRDRALLLTGWVGSFRRSELTALDVADVEFRNSFAVVHVRSSKTDQEGKGEFKKLSAGSSPHTCPVRSLRVWLEEAHISSGALFRAVDRWGNVSDERLAPTSVSRIVKAAAETIGLDRNSVSSHSLRRGHISQARRNNCPKMTIQNQTGHRSQKMIDLYTQAEDVVQQSSADWLGH